MDGPLPAVLALAVVVAAAAVAPVGTGPAAARASATPVVQQPDSTSFLALPGDQLRATRYEAVTIDAAGSVALEDANAHARYLSVRITESFRNASTAAGREAALNSSAARIEARIDALHQRERRALAAFNEGRLSAQGYLRELAAVHAQATALQGTVRTLVRYNRVANRPLALERLARMKAMLIPLRGPVRQEVATAMRGTDAARVYVETSETGVVLGSVVAGEFSTQFVREAYYGGGFDLSGPLMTNFSTERDRFANEYYPWTNDNGYINVGLLTSSPNYATAGVFGMRADHEHGTSRQYDLISYLDGHTGEVFREIQYKDVSALPTRTVANATNESLHLRVQATHGSGPMLVNVTDAAADEPRNATVYVNGQTVADTGPDGELWTVAPRAGFNVTVATGDARVVSSARAG